MDSSNRPGSNRLLGSRNRKRGMQDMLQYPDLMSPDLMKSFGSVHKSSSPGKTKNSHNSTHKSLKKLLHGGYDDASPVRSLQKDSMNNSNEFRNSSFKRKE